MTYLTCYTLESINKQLARDLFAVIGPHMFNSNNYKAIHHMLPSFTALPFYASPARVTGYSIHYTTLTRNYALASLALIYPIYLLISYRQFSRIEF